jgi:putative endonuclease
VDSFGRWGEDRAAQHLLADGIEILERNWRCELGEIDLIGRDGEGVVVMCEVKTRRGCGYGTPAEAVTPAKVRRLRRLAGRWLAATRPHAPAVRLDIVSVFAHPDGTVGLDHVIGIG